MSASAGTVTLELDANSVKLLRELQKTTRATKRSSGKMKRDFAAVKMAALKVAASVAAIGYAVVRFTKATSDAADKMIMLDVRMKRFAGSADAFAQTVELAKRLGISLDDAGAGMTRFLIATQKLGVPLDQIKKMQENIVLLGRAGGSSAQEMSSGMIQLGQGMASGRLQGEELRSVLENIPLVAQAIAEGLESDIGQIRKLASEGKITTKVVVKALQDIGMTMADLPETFGMVTETMSTEWDLMLAVMGKQWKMKGPVQWFTDGMEAVRRQMGDFADLTTADLKEKQAALNHYINGLKRMQEERAGHTGLTIMFADIQRHPGVDPAMGGRRATSDDIAKQYKDQAEALKAINAELAKREAFDQRAAPGLAAATAARAAATAMAAEAEAEKKRLEALYARLGVEGKGALDNIAEGLRKSAASALSVKEHTEGILNHLLAIGEITPGEHAKGMAEAFEAAVDAMPEQKLSRFKGLFLALGVDGREGFNSLRDSIISAGISTDELNEKLLAQARLMIDIHGGITQEQYDKFAASMEKTEVTHRETFSQMAAYTEQAARNMQNAFAEFLFDPFDKGLKGMLKSFIDTIRRMLANQMALKIFGFFRNFGIEEIDMSTLPGKRALGGPVAAGQPYVVGERGPELLMMGASSGTVIPNNKLQSSGGHSFVFNTHIESGGGNDPQTLIPLLEERDRKLKGEFLDELNRGTYA